MQQTAKQPSADQDAAQLAIDIEDFIEVVRLELAKMLDVKVEAATMDELVSAISYHTPEVVGELYSVYQTSGFISFKTALKEKYAHAVELKQHAKPTVSHRQAMITWFYAGINSSPIPV